MRVVPEAHLEDLSGGSATPASPVGIAGARIRILPGSYIQELERARTVQSTVIRRERPPGGVYSGENRAAN
jgi:hypothetical protein